MSRSNTDVGWKCTLCGKFISYDELNSGDVIVEHIPESDLTIEETLMTHMICIELNHNARETSTGRGL